MDDHLAITGDGRRGGMAAIADLVDRYVGLWNEPDPEARRACVAALWAPDGITCNRLLESRGHEAIEVRVVSAHEQWVRGKGYRFRARTSPALHHGVAKIGWEMVAPGGCDVVSAGSNVLGLDDAGRIRADYQFAEPGPPPSRALRDLAERYVAFWNESSLAHRRRRLVHLWAEDAAYVAEPAERRGRRAIEAEAARAADVYGGTGCVFRVAGDVDGHHDVVRLRWEMCRRERTLAAGVDLLVLDDDGRIRIDYQFDEPVA